MKTFTIMPEQCKWYNITAATAESAYRQVCYFYNTSRKIAVRDVTTGTTQIFSQRADINGCTAEVVEVTT